MAENNESKEERTRRLRYKRPALKSLGYELMEMELSEICEACSDVEYFVEDDQDTLLNALNGDEDAEYEFRIAFSDVSVKAQQLWDAITEWDIREEFDTCTVALIGNRYKVLGYDAEEEDYFALCSYDEELAHTESGKKLMRHTKAEMISIIGQCLGIMVSFLDLRQQYDYLKATMDILRDENTSLLKTIKEICVAYSNVRTSEQKITSGQSRRRRKRMVINIETVENGWTTQRRIERQDDSKLLQALLRVVKRNMETGEKEKTPPEGQGQDAKSSTEGEEEAMRASPSAEEASGQTRTDAPEPTTFEAPAYKGFLLIRCEDCGKVCAYNSRNETREFTCRECGHVTPLRELAVAEMNCQTCKTTWTYKTNGTDAEVSCRCIGCAGVLRARWDKRLRRYMPVSG